MIPKHPPRSKYDTFMALSDRQKEDFQRFKTTFQSITEEEGIARPISALHPHKASDAFTEIDAYLLRFFEARRYNYKDAVAMYKKFLHWRQTVHVGDICQTIRFPWLPDLKEAYPHAYHGTDRSGRPVYIERIGQADMTKVFNLAPTEDLKNYFIFQYEYLLRVIFPACTIAAQSRVDQGITILDLGGLGLSHFGKRSRTILKQFAEIGQNYYPEILYKFVIVNAPSIFGTMWAFVKNLMDEATLAKTELFTYKDITWRTRLQELIPSENLPAFLGGQASDSDWLHHSNEILKEVARLDSSIPEYLLYLQCPHQSPASLVTTAPVSPSAEQTEARED